MPTSQGRESPQFTAGTREINTEVVHVRPLKMGDNQAQKGALDAKRGKIFTRLIKEITIAAKPAVEAILTVIPASAPHRRRPPRQHPPLQRRIRSRTPSPRRRETIQDLLTRTC